MESKIEHIFQLIVFDRREKLTRDTGEETDRARDIAMCPLSSLFDL